MLSTAINLPTRRSYVYENSRYNPVTGFSTRGLMPTDRKALSNRDGTDGYNTLEEASEVLLSKGWNWDPDSKWDFELKLSDVDAEGYSYSVDFQHFTGDNAPDAVMTCGGTANKTMIHFVRRRRLARNQCFDVTTITDTSAFTCDHCDLQEVEKLGRIFLDKLTAASINRHPRNISERKINALKNEMIDIVLQLSPIFIQSTGIATASVDSTVSTLSATPLNIVNSPYSYNKVSGDLDSFISSCRTTLSMASSVFKSGDTSDHFAQRQQEVSRCFAVEERTEWSKLLLRKLDVEYNFHCATRNCGPSCIFAIESCPNIGCCVYFSRKWAKQHDDICPEKVLLCPRACGEQRLRKHVDTHLRNDCILRPIDCPYYSVGCKHDLVFKDLEEHLQSRTQYHMDLMFKRLMEQQSVIQSLHQQVHTLEVSRQEQQQEIVGLSAALAAATMALKASELRQDKVLKDEIQKVDSKYSRQVASLQTDISQIRGILPRK